MFNAFDVDWDAFGVIVTTPSVPMLNLHDTEFDKLMYLIKLAAGRYSVGIVIPKLYSTPLDTFCLKKPAHLKCAVPARSVIVELGKYDDVVIDSCLLRFSNVSHKMLIYMCNKMCQIIFV